MRTPVSCRFRGPPMPQWQTAVQLPKSSQFGSYAMPSKRWALSPPHSRVRCTWTIIGQRQTRRWLRFQPWASGSHEFPVYLTLSNQVLLHISLSQAQCFESDLSGSSLYGFTIALSVRRRTSAHSIAFLQQDGVRDPRQAWAGKLLGRTIL